MAIEPKHPDITESYRTIYYYFRTKEGKPIITVCLLETDNEYARGIALCSKLDQPKKQTGRNIALGRAAQAFINKKSFDLIITDRAFESIFDVEYRVSSPQMSVVSIESYKSTYDPELTQWELKLLGKVKE